MNRSTAPRVVLVVALGMFAAAACSGTGPAPAPPTTAQSTTGATSPPSPQVSALAATSNATISAQAWLRPSQLPFAGTFHWVADPNGADESTLPYTCISAPAKATFATTVRQMSVYQPGPGSVTPHASVDATVIAFPDAAQAQAFFAQIATDYRACAKTAQYEAGTRRQLADDVTTTASQNAALAFVRTFRSESGAASGSPIGIASDTHEYFAHSGDLISVLRVNGDAAIDGHAGDAATLRAMSAALASPQD